MELVSTEHLDGVAVLRLCHGVTNALNPELVTQLVEAIEDAECDPAVHGLVLSSANEKFFSIGLDLPGLFYLTRKEFEFFWRKVTHTFLKLHALPLPTAAALTGHAIAGGCVLALCCDYRLMADRRKLMGLNEAKLGVPVPSVADLMLQGLVGVQNARKIIDGGRFYPPKASLRLGMVDELVPLEQVLEKAIDKVRLASPSATESFARRKRARVASIQTRVVAGQEEETELFIDLWYSDEVRALLKEAMEKF